MSRPLSLIQIDLIYTSHNIVFERSDLYYDFTLTLDDLVESTYLGHDMMDENERLIHFKWCWKKACDLVNTNGINFSNNSEVYIYFLDLYFETFYNEKSKHYLDVKMYWSYIFNYNIKKTRSDIDRYVNLYKIFEQSYRKANYLV
jgi:hypothetical protein